MKDILLDLVQHTHKLGIIDLIKITGTDQETIIKAVDDAKSVIVEAKMKVAIPQFVGTFGMPNLSKLNTILGFSEYDDTSVITVTSETRNDEVVPTAIHFETKNSDFVNDYRLMSKAIIEEKMKNITFKGATWNVEFNPSVQGILRLKKQAQANSEEPKFTVRVENGDVKMYFGEPSSHSGNFVFHNGVSGTMTKQWMWPVKQFISILDLVGDKTIKLSEQGVASITVDSGIADYTYLLPGSPR